MSVPVRPPWREVVRYEVISLRSSPPWGAVKIRLTLACGHTLLRKASRYVPKRTGCPECAPNVGVKQMKLHLTPNQMILLLEIHRGTWQDALRGGTFEKDTALLLRFGLILQRSTDDWCVTRAGQGVVQELVEATENSLFINPGVGIAGAW